MLRNLRAGLVWLRTGLAWALLERLAAIVRWRDRLARARRRHALGQTRWR
jgi:hypothetical protein